MENNHLIKNILLVEDDKDDQEIFADALHQVTPDCTLTIIENGIKLLYRFNDPGFIAPDILVLDLNLPLMTGLECLRQIKSNPKLSNIKVVIHSTSTSRTEIETAFKYGANLYIPKHPDFKEMKMMLEKLLILKWEKYIPQPKPSDFVWGRMIKPRTDY